MEETLPQPTSDVTRSRRLFLRKRSKQNSEQVKNRRKLKTWQKVLLIALTSILALLLILLSYSAVVAKRLKNNLTQAQQLGRETLDLVKTQNIPALPEKITGLYASLDSIRQDYQALKIYNYLPWIRLYYQDGLIGLQMAQEGLDLANLAVNTLLPYSDLLGFSGEGSFTGGTAQDRIVLILETIEEIQPNIDQMEKQLIHIEQLAQNINTDRYPKTVKDYPIRQTIVQAQDTLTLATQTFHDYKPVLAELAKMAGAKEAQKYLVLFQNDNELRPTGGFLTAYSITKIDKGTITPEKSDDIYELDQKFTKAIAIPDKLGKYLTTERYWNLRDMNISPDFKESMQTFYQYYQQVPGEPDDIDGIIAVDTHLLTELLRLTGPINLPGYGTFSAEVDPRCDCPQVVYALSEIITKPTPYLREDRKGVLGPLMGALLSRVYELDKSQFPALFSLALSELQARHIQLYFVDEASQTAAEQINAAGRLYEQTNNLKGWTIGQDLDFLAIVDANLAGAKSNLFVQSEVEQTINTPENGFLTKTVAITYRNTAAADNCNLEAGELCLNSTLNDWLRIYLPLGSELIEIQGIDNQAEVYEESGFTVIDGYFQLEPLGLSKIVLTYKVPYTDLENYHLKMWKQGGIDPVSVLIDVTGGEELLTLDQDIEYSTVF